MASQVFFFCFWLIDFSVCVFTLGVGFQNGRVNERPLLVMIRLSGPERPSLRILKADWISHHLLKSEANSRPCLMTFFSIRAPFDLIYIIFDRFRYYLIFLFYYAVFFRPISFLVVVLLNSLFDKKKNQKKTRKCCRYLSIIIDNWHTCAIVRFNDCFYWLLSVSQYTRNKGMLL